MRLFQSFIILLAAQAAAQAQLFTLQVVDSQTGRGVPLVEMTPTGGQPVITDSGGIIAIDDPAQLNRLLSMGFRSYGYQDGSGAFQTTPGNSAQIAIQRRNLAERLYRVTGQGIYEDSV